MFGFSRFLLIHFGVTIKKLVHFFEILSLFQNIFSNYENCINCLYQIIFWLSYLKNNRNEQIPIL